MRTVTETKTYNIYTFDELSERAKENCINEMRGTVADDNSVEMLDCMSSAMKAMNIKVDDYEIDNDGSGYINLSVDDDAEDLEGIRAYAWIVNNCFAGVKKGKDFWKGYKSRISNLESKNWMRNLPFSGVFYDEAVADAWDKWCDNLRKGLEPSVEDFLDKLGYAYLNILAGEYDAFDEDCAREIAEANEYEFLEDGTIYDE